MADQDYPELYAQLEASARRSGEAALSFEMMLGGTKEQQVPVRGFPDQPTLARRVDDKVNQEFGGQINALDARIGQRLDGQDATITQRTNAQDTEITQRTNAQDTEIARRTNAQDTEIARRTNAQDTEIARRADKQDLHIDTRLGEAEDHLELVINQTISQNGPPGAVLSLNDVNGFTVFEVDNELGLGTATNRLGSEGIRNPVVDILHVDGSQVQLADAQGFVAVNLAEPAAREEETVAVDLIAQRNAVNLAASAAVRGDFNSEIQRPTARYNHFLMFGQSLSTSNEGWPALSLAPFGGNLMLGDSTRPNGRYVANFTPLNVTALRPLKAVVQSEDGSTILTDTQVAALAPGAGNEGEGSEVSMLNFARKQFLQYHGLAQDTSRLFVASSCGVSGRTIEQLSKGASPEFYLRLLQAAQGVKAIANNESASYAIVAIIWMQGEFNYIPDRGGDTTKAAYKQHLLEQAAIWKSEIVKGVAGQDAPPVIITYQTGASFTRDTDDLSIGMAQFELSEEQPNWVMASPYYPYTDKGGHLDPNGYRWLGHQLGKVFHRVVTLGQEWKPLSPRRVTYSGLEVLIDFHVPCPPLVWDLPYVKLAATQYVDKGFRVIDGAGAIAIRSVKIVADTIVQLVLERTPGVGARVQYASHTGSLGNGCLRDSDPTVAMDKYEYREGSGQYPEANIPALVGKPYPLHNWCIAFSLAPTEI